MKNHLHDIFYSNPQFANCTMSKKDLKDTLLATDGAIIACGRLYDIVSKHLGVGVYKITLKRQGES